MVITDIYSFTLTIPDVGNFNVIPVNSEIEFEWTQFEDLLNYTEVVSNELTFDTQVFDLLYTEELNGNRCKEFVLLISSDCQGTGRPVERIRARFNLRNCTFDVEKCRVDIDLSRQDQYYDCLTEYWDEENNIMDYGDPFAILGLDGEILNQINPTSDTQQQSTQFTTANLQLLEQEIIDFINQWNPGFLDPAYFNRVLSCQFQFFPNSDGGGITGRWSLLVIIVRSIVGPPPLNYGIYERPSPPLSFQGGQPYIWNWVNEQVVGEEAFQNARYLNEVLTQLFDDTVECTPVVTLRSNFFGINPSGPDPINGPYLYAQQYLRELAIIPCHDISKLDETEASFDIQYSFQDILKDLINMFNLAMWREESGAFRLEHISYRPVQNPYYLDLTQDDFVKYLSGKYKFSYDDTQVPKVEEFTWVAERETGQRYTTAVDDFESWDIRYPEECRGDDVVSYETRIFITDPALPTIQDMTGTKLFLMMALRDGVALQGSGQVSGYPCLNCFLGWPALHINLWTYGRPMEEGYMNDDNINLVQFEETKKQRIQEGIAVIMCCEDFELFSPYHFVKTQLGWGQIDQAVYQVPSNRMTFNLRHR